MILFIFCFYCLIGTAQYIIIANKFRKKWQVIKPNNILPKPILVQIANWVKFIAFSCVAIPTWPLWCRMTDEHIENELEKARKKMIDNDQI